MFKLVEKNKYILVMLAIVALVVLEFIANRVVPFMMDDIWYGTNLVTGQPLGGLGDILQSQVWHFNNWGGRCVTHGLLQLVIMTGELWADIINVLFTVLLSFMVCLVIGEKKPIFYLLIHALILAANPNIQMSMLWQAGVVNYVYSTCWILLFIWPYISTLDNRDSKFTGAVAWMPIIGLMAGWSNENMGPASFLLALFVTLYTGFIKKEKIKAWMVIGSLSSFIGSVLVVIAPGNFVRSATIEKLSLAETLNERFYMMLRAGMDYLLPVTFILCIAIVVKVMVKKEKLSLMQLVLLCYAIISYGAMILSPHYPDRATFGTMVVMIGLISLLLKDICNTLKTYKLMYAVTGLVIILATFNIFSVIDSLRV